MEQKPLYREVSRKASVGERIRIVKAVTATSSYANGDEMTVTARQDIVPFGVHTKEQPVFVYDNEYVVLEPITQETPAPPQQLDFLEAIALFMRENAAAIRKYLDEIEAPTPAQPKSLTRAGVIAKAKADVAEITRKVNSARGASIGVTGDNADRFMNVEFHVNREKRAVTALLRGKFSGKIWAKATAKAAPGDVFHAEIGKAIALRKALGLPVPDEYINAPKPEPAPGAVVQVNYDSYTLTLTKRRPEHDGSHYGNNAYATKEGGWIADKQYEIIDDTDVDYENTAEGSTA